MIYTHRKIHDESRIIFVSYWEKLLTRTQELFPLTIQDEERRSTYSKSFKVQGLQFKMFLNIKID